MIINKAVYRQFYMPAFSLIVRAYTVAYSYRAKGRIACIISIAFPVDPIIVPTAIIRFNITPSILG